MKHSTEKRIACTMAHRTAWLFDYRSGPVAGDVVTGVSVATAAFAIWIAYSHLVGIPPGCGLSANLLR